MLRGIESKRVVNFKFEQGYQIPGVKISLASKRFKTTADGVVKLAKEVVNTSKYMVFSIRNTDIDLMVLWLRDPKKVTDEEYMKFYQSSKVITSSCPGATSLPKVMSSSRLFCLCLLRLLMICMRVTKVLINPT